MSWAGFIYDILPEFRGLTDAERQQRRVSMNANELQQFISFVQELFPGINPYTAQRATESIKEVLKGREARDVTRPSPFPYLAQGDIIGPLAFHFIDEEGDLVRQTGYAFLLSNTCDAENDDWLSCFLCYTP